MSTMPSLFDYEQLEPEVRTVAVNAALVIRLESRRAAASIVAIGRALTQAKDALGYGRYLPWLKTEFGWSESQALRFVHVRDLVVSKSVNLADLAQFDLSALYLLAAPSTPDKVWNAALKQAAGGQRVTHADARTMLGKPTKPAPVVAAEYEVTDVAEVAGKAEPTIATAEPEGEEDQGEEEIDDTRFVRERIEQAYELVTYYREWRMGDVADLIDSKGRVTLARKAKRLGNWLKEFGRVLERQ